MRIIRSSIVLVILVGVVARFSTTVAAQHTAHENPRPTVIDAVRQATEPFRDIRNVPADYAPALGCVNGPDKGAMGVHFINGGLLMNDVVDITQPEALIYEFKDGMARFVGVEYIVLAEVWHRTHAANDPPVLAGQQLLQFVDTPNRFGLPAFYELHVWAWRDNPAGAFADWNSHVSCEGQ